MSSCILSGHCAGSNRSNSHSLSWLLTDGLSESWTSRSFTFSVANVLAVRLLSTILCCEDSTCGCASMPNHPSILIGLLFVCWSRNCFLSLHSFRPFLCFVLHLQYVPCSFGNLLCLQIFWFSLLTNRILISHPELCRLGGETFDTFLKNNLLSANRENVRSKHTGPLCAVEGKPDKTVI